MKTDWFLAPSWWTLLSASSRKMQKTCSASVWWHKAREDNWCIWMVLQRFRKFSIGWNLQDESEQELSHSNTELPWVWSMDHYSPNCLLPILDKAGSYCQGVREFSYKAHCSVKTNKQNFPGARSGALAYVPARTLHLMEGMPVEWPVPGPNCLGLFTWWITIISNIKGWHGEC